MGGTSLLSRLFRIFLDNGADSVCIIINEEMVEVRSFVEQQQKEFPVPLRMVVESTPSSFHSFYALKPFLEGADKFCLTTVDPIFREEEFTEYIRAFSLDKEDDALMAVTDYIDDERPLYVKTAANFRITGYASEAYDGARYISGGIYCMNSRALAELPVAMQAGISRMRGFQQHLVDAGLRLRAYPFSKVIDIDHAADVTKAEQFLKLSTNI